MKYRIFNVLPEFGTNTYLLEDEQSRQAAIIDLAAPDPRVVDFIKKTDLVLKYIINTHGHGDHIAGNGLLKEHFQAELLIHRADADMLLKPARNLSLLWGHHVISPPADRLLAGGEKIFLGESEIEVISTPGHTPGGICLFTGELLFCGDTLFAGSIGRTDLPGSDHRGLIKVIRNRLFLLPDNTIVLPGHGPVTTIGTEKINNPFVGQTANF
ncbi:MAG: MBL fold metallo-hydrolase [Candidatus Cloacimonetes bacterium]|nr:MBL fold metallo-hydrolase [Candidatus Cloacimonadota bacterium]